MDIGETEIPAGVPECERLMVETEEVKERGMEVMDMHRVLGSGESKFIGAAIDGSAFDPATGKPHGEAVIVVVATVLLTGVGAWCGQLDGGCPAKFTAPNHQCILEHAALLEIGQQGADRLVALFGQATVTFFNVVVVIPRLT